MGSRARARAAATQLLAAVDRMERSTAALRTLCAALDRDVFSIFELLFGDPQRYPCVERPGLHRVRRRERARGRRRRSIAGSRSPCIAAGRVLSTTLTHRYDPYRSPIRSASSSTRACCSCATPRGSGAWRRSSRCCRSTPSGTASAYTDAELARLYRPDAADGPQDAPPAAARLQPPRARRPPSTRPRPRRARRAGRRSRGRRRGPGVRVPRARPGRARRRGPRRPRRLGRCVALRSAGPLPARFDVHLRDERAHELEVARGRRARARAGRHQRGRRPQADPRRGRPPRPRRPRARAAARPVGHGRRDARASSSASVSYSDDARVTSG